MSFGIVVYAYLDYSKPATVEPQFYCGMSDIHSNPTAYTSEQIEGESLFKNNCAFCHTTTDEAMVGPGLKGISERKKLKWIVTWVNNPDKVLKSGDKYANNLYLKYNKAQMIAFPSLQEKDIKAILSYIDSGN
jgi:cytochrome c2